MASQTLRTFSYDQYRAFYHWAEQLRGVPALHLAMGMRGASAGQAQVLRAELPLRKSFDGVYAQCYHRESLTDLDRKVGIAVLEGLHLRPEASPRELLEGIKTRLAMFSPKRRAASRRFVAQVEPVMEVFAGLEEAAATGRDWKFQVENTVELVLEDSPAA